MRCRYVRLRNTAEATSKSTNDAMNSHLPLVIAQTSYCSHRSATRCHASLTNINGLPATCTGGKGFVVLLRSGTCLCLIGVIRVHPRLLLVLLLPHPSLFL